MPCTPQRPCRPRHVCEQHRWIGHNGGKCPVPGDTCSARFVCMAHRESRHEGLNCPVGEACTIASQCAIHKPAWVTPCLYE